MKGGSNLSARLDRTLDNNERGMEIINCNFNELSPGEVPQLPQLPQLPPSQVEVKKPVLSSIESTGYQSNITCRLFYGRLNLSPDYSGHTECSKGCGFRFKNFNKDFLEKKEIHEKTCPGYCLLCTLTPGDEQKDNILQNPLLEKYFIKNKEINGVPQIDNNIYVVHSMKEPTNWESKWGGLKNRVNLICTYLGISRTCDLIKDHKKTTIKLQLPNADEFNKLLQDPIFNGNWSNIGN